MDEENINIGPAGQDAAPQNESRICRICKKPFMPNKYRPNQEVCSSIECQYQRQLDNMKIWRDKNPNYFKYKEVTDSRWKESCRERARKWRQNHLEYLKLYRQEHKDQHREYMRNYMREYRRKKRGSQTELGPSEGQAAPPGTPQQ